MDRRSRILLEFPLSLWPLPSPLSLAAQPTSLSDSGRRSKGRRCHRYHLTRGTWAERQNPPTLPAACPRTLPKQDGCPSPRPARDPHQGLESELGKMGVGGRFPAPMGLLLRRYARGTFPRGREDEGLESLITLPWGRQKETPWRIPQERKWPSRDIAHLKTKLACQDPVRRPSAMTWVGQATEAMFFKGVK